MLINEKYKGDFHIQKYYTPEGKRKHIVKNNEEVKSFYVSENHPVIVSEEEWQLVQKLMNIARTRGIFKAVISTRTDIQ